MSNTITTNNDVQIVEFTAEDKLKQIEKLSSKSLEIRDPVSKHGDLNNAKNLIKQKIEDDLSKKERDVLIKKYGRSDYELLTPNEKVEEFGKILERKWADEEKDSDISTVPTIGDRISASTEFTAEEKMAQVEKAIKETIVEDLTVEDELNILEEKGVEYKFKYGEKPLTMYIKPLSNRQQRLISEHEAKCEGLTQVQQKLETMKLWSELFNVSYEDLEAACIDDDFVDVWAALAVVQFHGKSIFKKKVVTNREFQTAKKAIKQIHG